LSSNSDEPSRCADLADLYGAGKTYEEIGRKLGVTRQRVDQLLDDCGIARTPRQERLQRSVATERGDELEALFLELRDDAAVASRTGVPAPLVRHIVDERIPDADVLRGARRRRGAIYRDEDLVRALQAAARELSTPFAHSTYANWSRGRTLADGRPWPGPQAAMLRFGGWRAALARSGLPANPSAGPERRWDLQDGIDGVVTAWRELGHAPTVEEYDRWQVGRNAFPSSATVRQLVDSWIDVRLAAWSTIHGRQLPGIGASEVSDAQTALADPARVGVPYVAVSEDVTVAEGDPFERDPQQLERALRSHAVIQNALARLAVEHNFAPLSPGSSDPDFDFACRGRDGRLVVVEVKSAKPSNLENQLRIGLGQLLRYGEAMAEKEDVAALVLAVELEPADPVWDRLLSRLGILLVTPERLVEAFGRVT
jgi:hypothetical protein